MFGNILHPLPRKYVREDLRLQHRKQESFYLAGYGLLRTVFYNPIFDSSNAENAVVSSFSAFLMIKKCSYILLLFLQWLKGYLGRWSMRLSYQTSE